MLLAHRVFLPAEPGAAEVAAVAGRRPSWRERRPGDRRRVRQRCRARNRASVWCRANFSDVGIAALRTDAMAEKVTAAHERAENFQLRDRLSGR